MLRSSGLKLRFFRYDQALNQLKYFKSETATKAQGLVDLTEVSKVELGEIKGRVMLSLHTPKRVWSFSAPDLQDLAKWTALLTEATRPFVAASSSSASAGGGGGVALPGDDTAVQAPAPRGLVARRKPRGAHP